MRLARRRQCPVESSACKVAARQAELEAERQAARALPWAGVRPGDERRCPGGRRQVAEISCLVYGEPQGTRSPPEISARARDLVYGEPQGNSHGPHPARPVAMVLHGNPSEAEAMAWLAPPLVHAGYMVVCPDMPGFGESKPPSNGARMRTRSEQACDDGGPADVVKQLLESFKARSCTLVGYDWGAGIALAMAASAKHRRLVEKMVCMHPAFASERVPDELRTVQAATLVMWAEDNAFHSWARFKPLAAKLRSRLGGDRYAEYRTRREADSAWSEAARSRGIVRFLTGIDFLPEAQTVTARPLRSTVAADGSSITQSDGVLFRGQVTADMLRRADPEVEACAELVRAASSGEIAGMLRELAGAGGAARERVMARFARSLPRLDESTITPAHLQALGLWSTAAQTAAEALQERIDGTARYFVGRVLLVPGDAHTFGVLRSVDASVDRAVVSVRPVGEIQISWRALLRLNQRHVLPSTQVGDGAPVLHLEDGLWADFGSPLLRAMLARMAHALDAVFANEVANALMIDDAGESLEQARAAAVVAMRSCLDVTSFAREGGADRGRDRSRYAKDDVAKMAAHGEGHCRTCSSCFAPFLWAFADLLGIDPHYCADAGGRHQWLQYEARPTMRSFACDLYRDEEVFQRCGTRGALLAQPTEDAYGWEGLFPSDEPPLLSGRLLCCAPLQRSDVCL